MSVLMDEETVVLDALDFEPPCAVSDDHAAVFAVSCRNCGVVLLMCSEHLEVSRARALAIVSRPGKVICCNRCAKGAKAFDELFSVVPL